MENGQAHSPPLKYSRLDSASEDQDQIYNECLRELYVLQHFQITPEDFTDTVFNLTVHHFVRLFPIINKTLKEIKGDGTDKDMDSKIHSGFTTLVKSFYASLEKNTDVMLVYLKKNIITIPTNVVLPSDKIQLKYRSIVKELNTTNKLGVEAPDDQIFTEENTADLLTKEAENLREKLRKKKMEKLRLEQTIRESDLIAQRMENMEKSLNKLNESLPCPVREYVVNNISAALDISGFKLKRSAED